jgi:hypothetical protein
LRVKVRKKTNKVFTKNGVLGKYCTGVLCQGKIFKSLTDYYCNKRTGNYFSYCKVCQRYSREKRVEANPFKYLASSLRERGKRDGIKVSDIDWESYLKNLYNKDNKCKVTGFKMNFKRNDLLRVSVDRINNDRGYVKGNIRLVTRWANNARNNMKIENFDPKIKSLMKFIKAELKENKTKLNDIKVFAPIEHKKQDVFFTETSISKEKLTLYIQMPTGP